MSEPRREPEPGQTRYGVPADIDKPDTLVFGLTGRQCAILAGTAAVLWVASSVLHGVVPPLVLAAAGLPVAAAALVVALGHRDGVPLDRWLASALAHRRSGRRLLRVHPSRIPPVPAWITTTATGRVPARVLPGPLRLPARGITPDGLIDLGPDGTAAIAACSTVNLALRTGIEQQALVGGFARLLHGLDQPIQIVVRAARVDLSDLAAQVAAEADRLPHPALCAAAAAHAQFLADLSGQRELLARSVLVVAHSPTGPEAGRAAARAVDYLARGLSGVDVAAVPLDGAQTAATLAACADPYTPTPPPDPAGMADPDQPVGYAAPPALPPEVGEGPVVPGAYRAAGTPAALRGQGLGDVSGHGPVAAGGEDPGRYALTWSRGHQPPASPDPDGGDR